MKIVLLLLTISLSVPFINAQDLMDRVPSSAEFVMQMNLDKLDKIYPYKKIFKLDIWKDGAEEMDMKSLAVTGINFAEPAIFEVDLSDSCTYFSIHIHIANQKQFYEFLAKQSRNMNLVKDYKGSGLTLMTSRISDQILIGKNTATIMFAEMNRSYRRNNLDYLMEKYDDDVRGYEYEYEHRKAIEAIIARDRSMSLISNNSNPFNTSECYKLFDKTNEVTFWMNDLYKELARTIDDREFRRFSNVFSTFDGHMVGDFAMEKGSIDMEVRLSFDQDIQEDIKSITAGRKLNKEYLKYVPADRTALYFMSINPRAYYDWLKRSLAKTLGRQVISDQTVQDVVDLIETLIDEDAISKLISGDVLMSFNGLETIISEYKTSRYNENYEMVDEVRKQELNYPEFTIIIGVNNRKFFEKIQNILKRENILTERNGYLFVPPYDIFRAGLGVYLGEDKMILSTDFGMLDNIESGKLYEDHALDAKTNFYAELRIKDFFQKLADESNNYTEFNFFNFMSSTFDRIEIMADPNEKKLSAKGNLYMVDQKKNAYFSLMNGFNALFLKMEKNRTEGKYEFYSDRIEKLIKKYENLPADRKSEKGDSMIKVANEILKNKKGKEEPFILREIIWSLEELIEGNEEMIEYNYE